MPKKITNDDFIRRANSIHNNKYDYSEAEYIKACLKVKIICKEKNHGAFFQTPNSHLNGNGCPLCANEKLSKINSYNTQEFVDKAESYHGNKYDYSEVIYIDSKTKIKIICNQHGAFYQSPASHLSGYGCPKCGIEKTIKHTKKSKEDVIKEIKSILPPRYTLIEDFTYSNNNSVVKIICEIHGIQERPVSMIIHNLSFCPLCGVERRASERRSSKEDFIKKAQNIHGNLYDYSKVEYKNIDKKVSIVCKIHGVFKQSPYHHLKRGHGCPLCKKSLGEVRIKRFLEENNIHYIQEYRNNFCVYKRELPFDFYLPEKNIMIEFDGVQHYRSVDFFGGELHFKLRQKKDQIKTQFCKEHSIKLLRIPYSNIENIPEVLSFLKV